MCVCVCVWCVCMCACVRVHVCVFVETYSPLLLLSQPFPSNKPPPPTAVPIPYLLECPDCENGTCDSCPLHPIWKTLSNKSGAFDRPSMRFTSVRIPYHWRVQKSSIPGAGLGLFAQTRIPCGTRMGPYRGEHKVLSREIRSHNDMCYAWEVSVCIY